MDLDIQADDHPTSGRFFAVINPENEAEITYHKLDDGLRICNHTGVPPAYQGQGIAKALVVHLVNDARTHNLRYIPACPYVAAQFKRHPEWGDVFISQ